LGGTEQGVVLLLSPERPRVSAEFEFLATEQALLDFNTLSLRVHHDVIWMDLPERVAPELDVRLVKVAGPPLEQWQLGEFGCGADAASRIVPASMC
jgi:hypothetical protein